MELTHLIILLAAGVLAGFLNVVAGGGSLITLPLLIFLGLPPAVANGTNRIAITAQNLVAVPSFKKKGVFVFPYSIYVGIAALAGSIVGALLVIDLDESIFNKLLSIIMVGVAFTMIFNKKKGKIETNTTAVRNSTWGIVSFFFLGIYGGFIHAGIGFLMLLVLVKLNGFSLLKANSIKVTVALMFTISALLVFIINDLVDWETGLILGFGNAIGAYIGTVFSVKKGDKWIRRILVFVIIVLAVKLWFFN